MMKGRNQEMMKGRKDKIKRDFFFFWGGGVLGLSLAKTLKKAGPKNIVRSGFCLLGRKQQINNKNNNNDNNRTITKQPNNKQNKQSKQRGLGRTQGRRGGTDKGFRRGRGVGTSGARRGRCREGGKGVVERGVRGKGGHGQDGGKVRART